MTSHSSGRDGGQLTDRRLVEIDRPDAEPSDNWAVYGLTALSGTLLGQFPGVSEILSFTRKIIVNYMIGPPDFSRTGFHGSGEDAIGLIMVPSAYTGLSLASVMKMLKRALEDPSALPEAWGHTAIYVRHKGKITIATGFGPSTLTNSEAIVAGTDYATGILESASSMFNMVEAMTIEFPVDSSTAQAAAKQLEKLMSGGSHSSSSGVTSSYRNMPPPVKDYDGLDLYYVTKPNNFISGSQKETVSSIQNARFTNCVKWAVNTLESFVGAELLSQLYQESRLNVLDLGPTRGITAPNTASQGRLFREVVYASKNKHGNAMILRGKIDKKETAPLVSSYPNKIRVLYTARTLFLITGTAFALRQYGLPSFSMPTTLTRAGSSLVVATTTQISQEVTRLVNSVQKRESFEALRSLGVLGAAGLAIFAPGDNYGVLALMMGAYLIMALTNYFARRLR